MNATLCGQQSPAGDHPRLDVTFTFPTASGFVEMKTEGVVADSGAQLCIYSADRLRAARDSLCNMKQTKVDLRAANNAVMKVVGVVNAAINALAPSGQRFRCTCKVYVVKNIDKVYLSLDVLRGLRIVGRNFPKAGTSLNQHECNQCVIAAAAASHDCGCPKQILHRARLHTFPLPRRWQTSRK